jgi:signal transduction histidine kinase
MEDLRSLLEVLRHPGEEHGVRVAPTLAELPQVIEESLSAGMAVHSTVYLDGASQAHHRLAQAVYRIVQELLTNARRHAPGMPVRLSVRGDAASGVQIQAANHCVVPSRAASGSGSAGAPTGGTGLNGIAERATRLGGEVWREVDDQGVFRVAVWLPWIGQMEVPGDDRESREVSCAG